MISSATKQLSIILVNYRSENNLLQCLLSLERFLIDINHEIVIVNNDAEEFLLEIKKNFPQAVIIEQKENVGFGRAINAGAEISEGEILFILNPDTEILDDLNPIVEILEKNPEIGAVGPKLLGENGKIQEWSTGVEISFLDLIRNNLGLPRSKKIWESLATRETYWISGAALFIPREIFLQMGGFDENFFMYFEDNDLCRRIRGVGKKLLYFPEVAIRHWGGKSSQDSQKQKQYFFASQDYYFQKHFGSVQVFWLKLLRTIFLKGK